MRVDWGTGGPGEARDVSSKLSSRPAVVGNGRGSLSVAVINVVLR